MFLLMITPEFIVFCWNNTIVCLLVLGSCFVLSEVPFKNTSYWSLIVPELFVARPGREFSVFGSLNYFHYKKDLQWWAIKGYSNKHQQNLPL